MRAHQSSSFGSLLMASAAGAVLGASVALLLAPKSGIELRRQLNGARSAFRNSLRRRTGDVIEWASEPLEDQDGRPDPVEVPRVGAVKSSRRGRTRSRASEAAES